MPLTPLPFVEHPNLRVPLSLIVDDPAPCINPLLPFPAGLGRIDHKSEGLDTDVLTLSVPTHWPLYQSPRVETGGLPAAQASDAARLQPGRWLMRGSLITVSLPLIANVPVRLTIRAEGAPSPA